MNKVNISNEKGLARDTSEMQKIKVVPQVWLNDLLYSYGR